MLQQPLLILNQQYIYFLILALSLAGPLALSFDKKVAFYRQWRYLFPAMLLPAAIYIVWDIWFTSKGIWSFNENYIVGKKYFGLPIEEILFFFVVPYCCVFIYECIRVYFPRLRSGKNSDNLLGVSAIFLLLLTFVFWEKAYTAITALFLSLTLIFFFFLRKKITFFNSRLFLISYGVILIPFLIVNGFLTAMPVVIYNNVENLGIRLYSIPVEDVLYGMLLIFLNILFFELFRCRK